MSETLAQLIQRRKRELGLTWRELGARAGDAIGATRPINLHRHGQNVPMRDLPSDRVRDAIAAAIEVDSLTVFIASVISYAQTCGYAPKVVLDAMAHNHGYRVREHPCGHPGEFSRTLAPADAPSDEVDDIPRRAEQVADEQVQRSEEDKPRRRKRTGNAE